MMEHMKYVTNCTALSVLSDAAQVPNSEGGSSDFHPFTHCALPALCCKQEDIFKGTDEGEPALFQVRPPIGFRP